MKALVATDGSAGAIEAARSARKLFGDDAELLLVTVIPELQDPQETAGGFEGPAFTEEEAAEWAEQAAAAGRDALAETKEAAGEGAKVRLVQGDDPGTTMVSVADQVSADVLVIGSSDNGLLRRFLVGSVR